MTSFALTILVFAFVLTLSSAMDTSPKIPTEIVQKQYGRKCYALFWMEEKDYVPARSSCESYNGSLALIQSDDLNNFLAAILKENGVTTAWIGLNYRVKEDKYVWSDGTVLNPAKDFNALPSNAKSDLQDCIALYGDGKWSQEGCTSVFLFYQAFRSYICEFSQDNKACEGQ